MLDKTLLMNELRQWSHTVLENPQEKFNNLPACPHAKKTWDNNKVNVVISKCNMWSDLMDYIINFDDTYDVIIYCGDDYKNITADEVDTRINLLNQNKISGYATDVLWGEPDIKNHPLIKYAKMNDNVIITPHIGGNTFESIEKTEGFVLNKLIDIL